MTQLTIEELSDNGKSSGYQMSISIFVPIEPDVVQALVGHHVLEQLLKTRSVSSDTYSNY
jgi:hypothetical protein